MDNLIVKTTRELAEILDSNNLSKINVKMKDVEINIEAHHEQGAAVMMPPPLPPSTVTNHVAPVVTVSEQPTPEKTGNYVTSPIVGTFYAAPAPDKPPFVQIGDKVKKGQVVCIVESMKLMNEINSEFDGTVAAILAMDGEAVDFGKELIEIV